MPTNTYCIFAYKPEYCTYFCREVDESYSAHVVSEKHISREKLVSILAIIDTQKSKGDQQDYEFCEIAENQWYDGECDTDAFLNSLNYKFIGDWFISNLKFEHELHPTLLQLHREVKASVIQKQETDRIAKILEAEKLRLKTEQKKALKQYELDLYNKLKTKYESKK